MSKTAWLTVALVKEREYAVLFEGDDGVRTTPLIRFSADQLDKAMAVAHLAACSPVRLGQPDNNNAIDPLATVEKAVATYEYMSAPPMREAFTLDATCVLDKVERAVSDVICGLRWPTAIVGSAALLPGQERFRARSGYIIPIERTAQCADDVFYVASDPLKRQQGMAAQP
jgi:hypothetical protein